MKILQRIKNLFLPFSKMGDGYHTFEELYDHRVALFIELCKHNKDNAWYSDRHSDGSEAFGYPWVIIGINDKPNCQITYHVDKERYEFFDKVREEIKFVKFAPTYDHHTPADVIFRLKTGAYKKGELKLNKQY